MRLPQKIFAGALSGALFLRLFVQPVLAAYEESGGGHADYGTILLGLAIILLAAKLGGVIEKIGQPGVLGELLAGIALSLIGFLGIHFIDDIRHNEVIAFLAEVGAIILLFQIGLESNIRQLAKVGVNAFLVAIIGVVAPFLLGTFVFGPLLFPDAPFVSHLFLGASVVATSVGITASVFKSLGILKYRASQTVLGAAVIDDVLGLLVLAIVTALASGSELTPEYVITLSIKAFAFLAVAIVAGSLLAKHISKIFSYIHTGTGMKLGIAFIFALIYSYAASLVGLAPIIGAFAAGLVLDAVHFSMFDSPAIVSQLKKLKPSKELEEIIHHQEHIHVEDMVSSLGLIFVPLFFAFTGLQIQIDSLLNPNLYLIALVITIGAVLTKASAGIAARGSFKEKLLVGVSMVPRGEVGLIFASAGKALGAINDELFSVIILVVIGTTFIAPSLIKHFALQVKQEVV